MIDERLYTIGPEFQKKIEQELKYQYTDKMTLEKLMGRYSVGRKPFYDFQLHCKHGYEQGPYNPDNQAKYRAVYDRDDTISKAEFEKLSKVDQVKYVLYHQWKKGEVTEAQLKKINWFEIMFPNV